MLNAATKPINELNSSLKNVTISVIKVNMKNTIMRVAILISMPSLYSSRGRLNS